MTRNPRLPLLLAVLALLFQTLTAEQPTIAPTLPPIGPWMLTQSGAPAHWLGHKWQGKVLYEPINVVIIDTVSTTRRQAIRTLVKACKLAGYAVRGGHSSGYQASIDGQLFQQIPDNRMMAFSNARYTVENNHGRIMGPCRWENAFVFVAAFSREAYTPLASPPHSFLSFTVARDDFTARCNDLSERMLLIDDDLEF